MTDTSKPGGRCPNDLGFDREDGPLGCSLEMQGAPCECAAVYASRSVDTSKAAEERDEWLRFIARWAWDKTGPADERLSVIQYFPPVKAARPEPLYTLRSTKS